jgi:hypothetical protein
VGVEQYHESVNELPEQTRTFAPMIVSLTEEDEAINWYEQRIAVERCGTPQCQYSLRAKNTLKERGLLR